MTVMCYKLVAKFEWVGEEVILVAQDQQFEEGSSRLIQKCKVLTKGERFPPVQEFDNLKSAKDLFSFYCGKMIINTAESEIYFHVIHDAEVYQPTQQKELA